MRRTLLSIAAAAALFITSSGLTAAATKSVTIVDYAFNPTTIRVTVPGDSVRWTNSGQASHTTTRTAAVYRWNSGALTTGESFTRRFTAAGRFPYVCSFHEWMQATVVVPVIATPTSGSTATIYTIGWASITAPTGQRYQVQRRAPGATVWSFWKSGTTAKSATFTTTRVGTWSFRARLQRLVNGSWISAGWSPVRTVSVSSG
jgi:plastocyanin